MIIMEDDLKKNRFKNKQENEEPADGDNEETLNDRDYKNIRKYLFNVRWHANNKQFLTEEMVKNMVSMFNN